MSWDFVCYDVKVIGFLYILSHNHLQLLYENLNLNFHIVNRETIFFLKQAKSEKFVSDIGFKTRVSLHDALEILKLWRCENPFKARYGLIVFHNC